ncbi:hypothetical protein [Stappia indica]|uniref:Uncharacterized protein n=1 Tax=Stappia indica TaxID=538381 RepID=A0A285S7M1_9HYPH|nr:hypothetical protein [Stappia indica]SOC03531.1 hypothetical protein SAMN05421512_104162 [Stappia indica]
MKTKILDIWALSDHKNGDNLFVLDVDDLGDMAKETRMPAKVVSSDGEHEIPCEIYRPRPNNEFEPPHLQLRAASHLGLKHTMKVGDFVILED